MLNRRSLVGAHVAAFTVLLGTWMTPAMAEVATAEETPSSHTVRNFTAKAHSLKTGKLIYTVAYEEHWQAGRWTKRVMRASDLEGNVFLVRTLLPDTGFRTPKLEMVNERLNFKVGAERVGKKIVARRSVDDGQPEIMEFNDDASLDANTNAYYRRVKVNNLM